MIGSMSASAALFASVPVAVLVVGCCAAWAVNEIVNLRRAREAASIAGSGWHDQDTGLLTAAVAEHEFARMCQTATDRLGESLFEPSVVVLRVPRSMSTECGRRLARTVRAGELAIRLDRATFLVGLIASDPRSVTLAAERLVKELEPSAAEFRIGRAAFPADGSTLLALADVAVSRLTSGERFTPEARLANEAAQRAA